jgi:hypothetical protein
MTDPIPVKIAWQSLCLYFPSFAAMRIDDPGDSDSKRAGFPMDDGG